VETFCLVHGAWHDDACWAPLVAELERRGHECVTPVLPLDDLDATFEDYAQVVVDSLAGRPAPVLVGHSMSSAVIPIVAMRIPVRLLVYLCPAMAGFKPRPNEPVCLRASYVRPPLDPENRSWWPRERAIGDLYGRLDRELAARLAGRLRPQPQSVFRAPYPIEAPPPLPSVFLYAREDELFDDNWSRWIARTLVGVEPLELPGGHFPMLEHTEILADTLERISSAGAPPCSPA
jgi:pimeloyl-ACP methyl ester carboxylesterase